MYASHAVMQMSQVQLYTAAITVLFINDLNHISYSVADLDMSNSWECIQLLNMLLKVQDTVPEQCQQILFLYMMY